MFYIFLTQFSQKFLFPPQYFTAGKQFSAVKHCTEIIKVAGKFPLQCFTMLKPFPCSTYISAREWFPLSKTLHRNSQHFFKLKKFCGLMIQNSSTGFGTLRIQNYYKVSAPHHHVMTQADSAESVSTVPAVQSSPHSPNNLGSGSPGKWRRRRTCTGKRSICGTHPSFSYCSLPCYAVHRENISSIFVFKIFL